MKTLIANARILDPATLDDRVANLLIEDGVVSAISPGLQDSKAETVDAEGCWLLPGLVDIHAHLREPGFESRETIETGTRAAAAGGITSVVCVGDTSPPIDNRTGVEFILDRTKQTGSVRVYPSGAMTKGMKGREMALIGEMVSAGAVAISDGCRGIQDAYLMMRIMEYSTIFGIPIIDHCEDTSLTEDAHMNEGKMSTTMGILGWPREAEIIHAARDLVLAQKTGAHLHLTSVSCAETVDLIRYYKKKGVHVTSDTAPHYLLLTDDAVDRFDTNAKTNPPLRTASDQQALLDGLRDGTICCIASDHAPLNAGDKNQEFPNAPFGVIGFETMLPLVLGPIQEALQTEMLFTLGLLTHNPAQCMNLPAGTIRLGGPADLTLWEPKADQTLNAAAFLSKARNTPFDGWSVPGRVRATWVGGTQVFMQN